MYNVYLHAGGIGDGQGVLGERITGQTLNLTFLFRGGGI